MQIEDIKSNRSKHNALAAVDILGSYDFYTSIISLDSLTSEHVNSAATALATFYKRKEIQLSAKLTDQEYQVSSKVYPLVYHEYTHFVDSTSTLWGLQHLSKMNLAYLSSDIRRAKEMDFWYAKDFFDHCRGIRLPKYYTLINEERENTRPWQYQVTIGKRFDREGKISKSPIVFVRFSNSNGELLVRSPISPVSLLEASAMSQELQMHAQLLTSTEESFELVERHEFNRRTLQYLYDPRFTEYSVCVHLLANVLGLTDVLIAFTICAQITRLALNFPEVCFEKVIENAPIAKLIGVKEVTDPMCISVLDGLRIRDRGIIFYLMCMALPKDCAQTYEHFKVGVDSALSKLGVNIELMKTEAALEAEAIAKTSINSEISSISALTKNGLENFKTVGFKSSALPLDKMNLPPCILSDSRVVQLFISKENRLLQMNPDILYDELFTGQRWVERFSESCG